MVKYVRWGGIPQLFDPIGSDDWEQEREQLGGISTEQEFEAARSSTLNAHYTSQEIIRGMYAALERFGFRHGRILEPSCGIGDFKHVPKDQRERAKVSIARTLVLWFCRNQEESGREKRGRRLNLTALRRVLSPHTEAC